MARKPVSVFRRPMTKAGQYHYYIQLWDEATGSYATGRSAASIANELGLDEKTFPPSSRTGALLIGEELRRRGGAPGPTASPLSRTTALRYGLGTRHPTFKVASPGTTNRTKACPHNLAAAFKTTSTRLPSPPPFRRPHLHARGPHDEAEKDSGLGNRTINVIIKTAALPLHEAARLGLIASDPAVSIRKLGNDTREKGIPTEEEVRALVGLPGLDPRARCAILLGAACALRIGEIQALKIANIGEETLTVASNWSAMDGLKCTKTGRVRIVPLPRMIRDALFELEAANPHGPGHFLMYGTFPDAPLDMRALERMFYAALRQIGINETSRTARALSFHSLRHWSNATLRGSVSDAKLRLLTGHSTEAMTNRYDHATEADLAELAQAQEAKILPFLEKAVAPKAEKVAGGAK